MQEDIGLLSDREMKVNKQAEEYYHTKIGYILLFIVLSVCPSYVLYHAVKGDLYKTMAYPIVDKKETVSHGKSYYKYIIKKNGVDQPIDVCNAEEYYHTKIGYIYKVEVVNPALTGIAVSIGVVEIYAFIAFFILCLLIAITA